MEKSQRLDSHNLQGISEPCFYQRVSHLHSSLPTYQAGGSNMYPAYEAQLQARSTKRVLSQTSNGFSLALEMTSHFFVLGGLRNHRDTNGKKCFDCLQGSCEMS